MALTNCFRWHDGTRCGECGGCLRAERDALEDEVHRAAARYGHLTAQWEEAVHQARGFRETLEFASEILEEIHNALESRASFVNLSEQAANMTQSIDAALAGVGNPGDSDLISRAAQAMKRHGIRIEWDEYEGHFRVFDSGTEPDDFNVTMPTLLGALTATLSAGRSESPSDEER